VTDGSRSTLSFFASFSLFRFALFWLMSLNQLESPIRLPHVCSGSSNIALGSDLLGYQKNTAKSMAKDGLEKSLYSAYNI
jgi:hypothetical protein